jgi:glycolate oxidase iron-sulfur subunit
MQTSLLPEYLKTLPGQEANRILRSCVHCGFCLATCPTYQLFGDELDGPRGRIYLIKDLLEGHTVTQSTKVHLDRCLYCLSCETTCPSGVEFGRLMDIGREHIRQKSARGLSDNLFRWLIEFTLTKAVILNSSLFLARLFKSILPEQIKSKLNLQQSSLSVTETNTLAKNRHPRKMLLLTGCVQPALAPSINHKVVSLFDHGGIELIQPQNNQCCGALSLHLSFSEKAKNIMRHNIDSWWPFIEQGAEAIVITASGCAPTVKDYGYILKDDPNYATKATKIASMAKDVCEIALSEDKWRFIRAEQYESVVFQSPCSLQHGQSIHGSVEQLLTNAGYEIKIPQQGHLCCGAAGSYTLLQPEISSVLRDEKLTHLKQTNADVVATSNIGCLLQLNSQSEIPVVHWVELLDIEKSI